MRTESEAPQEISVAVASDLPGQPAPAWRYADKAARPQIVTILPRGETIRNFVYSGTLDRVSHAAGLTLLSVLPNGEIQDLLASRYDRVYELQEIKEHYAVNIMREILDMAHGRWLWSKAAQERWRLGDCEAVGYKKRLKRLDRKSVV